MKIFKSTVFTAALGCPCQKIGENGFGRVIPGNSHPDSGVTKFYAQVETPIGGVQIDDFKFVIQFSENIEVKMFLLEFLLIIIFSEFQTILCDRRLHRLNH